ncbi:hypothetical protein HBI23_091440 [Parastagonospora nodorum]|nr:hypothetical protein HBI74_110370 [Parastagonospora nodorum]KAH5606728.1 hypothetical protein HBI45_093180 [Parastagonospora nodorum]KAH5663046.1 hypothetical protein HBI23_091440 [Parastagonospora nodorum]KAH6012726.1 hypothetical protein HBI84_033200 [Parastagonospora nodorum]KAH6425635.1 hypothetical protein HBI14_064600 [Parastagonospora nodorum]
MFCAKDRQEGCVWIKRRKTYSDVIVALRWLCSGLGRHGCVNAGVSWKETPPKRKIVKSRMARREA